VARDHGSTNPPTRRRHHPQAIRDQYRAQLRAWFGRPGNRGDRAAFFFSTAICVTHSHCDGRVTSSLCGTSAASWRSSMPRRMQNETRELRLEDYPFTIAAHKRGWRRISDRVPRCSGCISDGERRRSHRKRSRCAEIRIAHDEGIRGPIPKPGKSAASSGHGGNVFRNRSIHGLPRERGKRGQPQHPCDRDDRGGARKRKSRYDASSPTLRNSSTRSPSPSRRRPGEAMAPHDLVVPVGVAHSTVWLKVSS